MIPSRSAARVKFNSSARMSAAFWKRTSINEVIGEMARMLGSEARRHGVSIDTDLKDDLPMTVADRVQL